MSAGFRGVFREIRPVDWVLAGALTAVGVWLMVENVLFHDDVPFAGTGRGLVGLRERIQRLGGQFSAGATGAGGWAVEARLPAS